jgi:hypothetical protein
VVEEGMQHFFCPYTLLPQRFDPNSRPAKKIHALSSRKPTGLTSLKRFLVAAEERAEPRFGAE